MRPELLVVSHSADARLNFRSELTRLKSGSQNGKYNGSVLTPDKVLVWARALPPGS